MFLDRNLYNIPSQFEFSDIILKLYPNFPTFSLNLPTILDARMLLKSGL